MVLQFLSTLPMKFQSTMEHCLRHVRLFEAMSESDRQGIARFMREQTFDGGETVCLRGQPGDTMFVILQGAFSVVVQGKSNDLLEIARVESGEVMGEMFCIDPAPRPATVVAVGPTKVLKIGRDDLSRMRRESPQSAASLISTVFKEILSRLRRVDNRLERELLAEDEAFFSDVWPEEERTYRELDDARIPTEWKACFSRIRGCA